MSTAFSRHLQRLWWRPRLAPLTALLAPLASLVAAVAARRRRRAARGTGGPLPLPVPVIVVGNLIVGGAGKTPTVIALVDLLRGWGFTPGIVSRGHGRTDAQALVLDTSTSMTADPSRFGDEPVLMHRRSGAPVAVARQRRDAALELLAAHPRTDVLVADDGLQHHALTRDVELVVFDDRGLGNGWTLPAGPLREAPSTLWPPDAAPTGARQPARFVLVNGRWPAPPALPLPAPPTTCWVAQRALAGALALPDWQRGERSSPRVLEALRGRRILAAAGIGDPERFFGMLEARGLTISRLPLADHADFDPLPWDASTTEVVVTEKDAVKLAGRVPAGLAVWVVTLDFGLPDGLARALRHALDAAIAALARRD